MPRCPMLDNTKVHSATCDPSGFFGCPKRLGRDHITPECFRLRRLTEKKVQALREKIQRNTLVKCPKCRFKFQAKEGL